MGFRRFLLPSPPATRPPDDDRVWAPAGGGGREWVGDGARGVRVVAATGSREQGAVLSRQNRLRGGGAARRAGPARRGDRKAQPAAVDRDPPSRNGDAAARDVDCGRARASERSALTGGGNRPPARLRPGPLGRAPPRPGGGGGRPRVSALQWP